jgi:hypothetical protein
MALPDRYQDDMKKIVGKLIPYDDIEVVRSSESKLQTSYELTQELWRQKFKNAPYVLAGCMWRGDPPALLPVSLRQIDLPSITTKRIHAEFSCCMVENTTFAQLHTLPSLTTYTCSTEDTSRLELCFGNQVVCIARKDKEGELVKAPSERKEHCFIISYDGEDWALVKAEWKGLRTEVPGVSVGLQTNQRGTPRKIGAAGSFFCSYIPLRGAILRGGLSGSVKVECTGRGRNGFLRPVLILRHDKKCILRVDSSTGSIVMNIRESSTIPMLMTALVLANLHNACRVTAINEARSMLTDEECARVQDHVDASPPVVSMFDWATLIVDLISLFS